MVYAEVAGLVARVLGGSNACIVAYGTSGSGKTFTLAGTPSQPGINFRAVEDLFRQPAPTYLHPLSSSACCLPAYTCCMHACMHVGSMKKCRASTKQAQDCWEACNSQYSRGSFII
jgi:hypothetical protein